MNTHAPEDFDSYDAIHMILEIAGSWFIQSRWWRNPGHYGVVVNDSIYFRYISLYY